MTAEDFRDVFTQHVLKRLFAEDRADQFFHALYGDAVEGAYDISLEFKGHRQDRLFFEFHLKERPNRCLGCSLTFGLPHVFSRHPIININGLVQEIDQIIDGRARCKDWQLGMTQVVSRQLHVIPLVVFLDT